MHINKQCILWLSALALLFVMSLYIPSSVFVSSQTSIQQLPIYSVKTEKKIVALSFDVALENVSIDEILCTLKKHNIKSTFFVTGKWADTYPKAVKRIALEGHDIGNHSEHHKDMSNLSTSECTDEIMSLHTKIKELTGSEMHLFRPPYGDYNDTLIATATSCGYYPIKWNVDSLDWKNYGKDNIISTVLNNKNLKNGSIILCHSGTKYTAKALEKIIEGLQEKGYTIVPVSEIIYKDSYTITSTGCQVKK